MKMLDVQIALEDLRLAREKWGKARTEFFSGYEWTLTRLIHQAMLNYMGVAQIATALGVSQSSVRKKMREIGLDPKSGKRALNASASQALLENSAIMGIEPGEMDLTSPLAYLPMGEQMRKTYQALTLSKVTDLVEDNESILSAGGVKCNVCRLNTTWVNDHCVNLHCPTNAEDTDTLLALGRILLRFLQDEEQYVSTDNRIVLDGSLWDATDEERTLIERLVSGNQA